MSKWGFYCLGNIRNNLLRCGTRYNTRGALLWNAMLIRLGPGNEWSQKWDSSGTWNALWGFRKMGVIEKKRVRKIRSWETNAKGVLPRSFPFGRGRETTESFPLLSLFVKKGAKVLICLKQSNVKRSWNLDSGFRLRGYCNLRTSRRKKGSDRKGKEQNERHCWFFCCCFVMNGWEPDEKGWVTIEIVFFSRLHMTWISSSSNVVGISMHIICYKFELLLNISMDQEVKKYWLWSVDESVG